MTSARRPPRFARFAEFSLDMDRARLLRADEPIAVPPRALDTLIALVRHRDRVVGKAELLDLVWPDTNVEEANLAQQVFTLRKILGDDSEQPRFIATLPRRGYRFICDVADDEGERPDGSGLAWAPPSGNDRSTPAVAMATAPAVAGEAMQVAAGPPRRTSELSPLANGNPGTAPDRMPAARAGLRATAWLTAAVATGLAAGLALRSPPREPPTLPAVRFDIVLPAGTRLSPHAGVAGLSPDGRVIAFVARSADQPNRIFVRRLDDVESRELRGTEDAHTPFWSPDGQRLGFFASGKLRLVSIEGGVPADVCDAPDHRGGSWGADDVLIFAAGSRSVIYRVPASGGTPVAVTHLDPGRRDISHRYPTFLSDGRRFLFELWAGDVQHQGIYTGDLSSPEVRRIVADASPPGWVAGHLLFVHHEALVAQPLDERTLKPLGEIVEVASPVARYPSDNAPFAAAGGRAITYVRSQFASRLVWLDRSGREVQEVGGPAQYDSPAVSRDGRRILFSSRDRARGNENFDVWASDTGGRERTRLTFDGSVDTEPLWSPDGREIVFRSNRSGYSDLYRRAVDGSTPETLLFASKARKDPTDLSPDGSRLVFAVQEPGRESDLYLLPLDPRGPPTPLDTSPGWQANARFSPDGQLIAYQSTEAGDVEVFVRSLGPGGRRWRIGEGTMPTWRADGRELLFLGDAGMTAVDVLGHGEQTTFGRPRLLFPLVVAEVLRNAFTITPDAQHFLVVVPVTDLHPATLTVFLNWPFRRSR